MHTALSLVYDRKYEGAGAMEEPTEDSAEKRLVRNGDGEGGRRAGNGKCISTRDEKPVSQSWHGTAAIQPPLPPPSPPATTRRRPPPVSLRVTAARETGETYIFPLYTLPVLIPFGRLQRFQIHVIKLAGSAACAHAKYIYTDR